MIKRGTTRSGSADSRGLTPAKPESKRDDRRAIALPHERLVAVLRKYNRLNALK